MTPANNNQQGKVTWPSVETHRISITSDWDTYTATWDKQYAGELRLYEDEQGRMWLNFISIEDNLQRRGIGLSLLNKAVQEHSEIYAATGMASWDEKEEDDSRHLSIEGAALVTSAVRNGILKSAWCFNPFGGYEHDGDY